VRWQCADTDLSLASRLPPGCSRDGRASPWTPVASAATDNAPYRLGRLTDETACAYLDGQRHDRPKPTAAQADTVRVAWRPEHVP
jgi:hypothetical protein